MPTLDIHLIKGELDAQQKQQMIGRVTDAVVSVVGENLRQATFVKLIEIESGDWGIGGQPVTLEQVRQIAAGSQP